MSSPLHRISPLLPSRNGPSLGRSPETSPRRMAKRERRRRGAGGQARSAREAVARRRGWPLPTEVSGRTSVRAREKSGGRTDAKNLVEYGGWLGVAVACPSGGPACATRRHKSIPTYPDRETVG